jgi:DNA modification methylase
VLFRSVIKINVDKTKEKALNIALNKISGEWDNEKLSKLFIDLESKIDLKLTGFDEKEYKNIMNEFEKKINVNLNDDDFDVEKELNNIEIPKVKNGEIYKLGNHVLMCGDSFNINEINKLIDNKKIDMMFTDPPYDMEMGGQGCFKSSTKNIKNRIDKIINFDVNKISHFKDLDINTFYICTSKNGIKDYLKIFDDFNFNILVWCKTNPTPFTAGTFLPDIEYILYFSRKNKIWNNSLKPTEIYKKYYISSKEFGKKYDGDLHPTMKPIELITNRILISSNEKGNVLDLFGGSGSTMISCEKSNRNCLMMESNEKYCDVIINRFEKLTGIKAELI